MALHLTDGSGEEDAFFSCKTDEDGHDLIDVPGALLVPKPYCDAAMPEVIRRDAGVEAVMSILLSPKRLLPPTLRDAQSRGKRSSGHPRNELARQHGRAVDRETP